MNKEKFLPILKEVSDKLESKNIKHDIPYTYLNKNEFEYINIIVPLSLDARELSTFLNIYDVKEEDNIITCKYKDFIFHFIKTDEQLWQFTFYYYCWVPLSNLLATTAQSIGLTYDRYGLRYKDEGVSFLISINLQDILEFFGLPFEDYIVVPQMGISHMGFATLEIIFSYFCMNNFFTPTYYTEKNIRKIDKYYDLNKKYYDIFFKYINMYNIKENLEDPFYYYYLANDFFPESDFLKKVYKHITKKDLPELGNLSELKDKDFSNLNMKNVINRAIEAEKNYKIQLNEKRQKRKETFKGLINDIKNSSKFKWE